jgi:hypothetical protein
LAKARFLRVASYPLQIKLDVMALSPVRLLQTVFRVRPEGAETHKSLNENAPSHLPPPAKKDHAKIYQSLPRWAASSV